MVIFYGYVSHNQMVKHRIQLPGFRNRPDLIQGETTHTESSRARTRVEPWAHTVVASCPV